MVSDTRTLGEHAYATYAHLLRAQWPMATWHRLTTLERYAWEAAAQAVLAMQEEKPPRRWTPQPLHAWDAAAQEVRTEGPGFTFALGQHVRRAGDPEHLWEIWWRSWREERGRTFIDYGLKLVDPALAYHPCAMSDGTDLVIAQGVDTPSGH